MLHIKIITIIHTPVVWTAHCVLEKPSQSRCKWFVAKEKKKVWVFSQALGGIMTPLTIPSHSRFFTIFIPHWRNFNEARQQLCTNTGLHLWFVLQRRSGATVTLLSMSTHRECVWGEEAYALHQMFIIIALTCNVHTGKCRAVSGSREDDDAVFMW